MKIVDEKSKVSLTELQRMAKEQFGQLVKAVVDAEKKGEGKFIRGVDVKTSREKL